MTTRRSRRHGVALVYTAIILLVLIAFAGLALDFGYVFWVGAQLQNSADAAAMAGAQQLDSSNAKARAAALKLASSNIAGSNPVLLDDNVSNSADGDVVIGRYDRAARTFTPVVDMTRNAVRVVARRNATSKGGPLPLFFGAIFGKKTTNVGRYAIAVSEGNPRGASIIALDDKDPQSFYLKGSMTLDLGDGFAQVNSTDEGGALVQGATGFKFIGDNINVVGGLVERGQAYAPYTEGTPSVDDPLASLPAPSFDSSQKLGKISGVKTFNPGYYNLGLNMNNGDNVVLNPGVYVLDNGFRINGTATLSGSGVTIYIKSGAVFTNGTCNIYLTPPTGGTYQGITFFQARDNTSPALFNGDGWMTGTPGDTGTGTGTFYFPNALLTVSGNGTTVVNKLVSYQIMVSGNGTKRVTEGYETWGSKHVYLVE